LKKTKTSEHHKAAPIAINTRSSSPALFGDFLPLIQ